jgi:hypothetical protein
MTEHVPHLVRNLAPVTAADEAALAEEVVRNGIGGFARRCRDCLQQGDRGG